MADPQTDPQADPLEELEDLEVPDTRRGARQLALLALYWQTSDDAELNQILAQLNERFALSEAVRGFAQRLAETVQAHGAEVDELVAQTATNWRPERLARVDALILRLALAEMLYFDDVPVRVSIDEAVELAKTYGGDRTHVFVNGVLDAIARRRGLAL